MARKGVQTFLTELPLPCSASPVQNDLRGISSNCRMGWLLVGFPIGTRPIHQLFSARNRLFSNSDFCAKPIRLFSIALD
jgi:hypothetical protein